MTICICPPAGHDEPGIPASYLPTLRASCRAHWRNVILEGDVHDCLKTLPAESVQMVVTSPPYWQQRDYKVEGQLGREATINEYVETLVDIFREVRRVLRPDGTLWLNIGDGYVTNPGNGRGGEAKDGIEMTGRPPHRSGGNKLGRGLKEKDLMGQPWRVALALQADGWWLRNDCIWSKPNPTPQSVTDRAAMSHEYVFLLTKQPRYFYDHIAVQEPAKESSRRRIAQRNFAHQTGGPKDYRVTGVNRSRSSRKALEGFARNGGEKRNLRTVWTIAPEPRTDEHFAAFPKKLVRPCILAGTSEWGACAACGAPWTRIVKIDDPDGRLGKSYHDHQDDLGRGQRGVPAADSRPVKRTVGWRPTCKHEAPVQPCLVLDPFMGSGTTAVVAWQTGRDYLGIELNPEYIAMAERRLAPIKAQGRLL